MIPEFPAFKPIALEDHAGLTAYLAAHPPFASEYTFTNLFAWRQAGNYQLARHGEGFLIRKDFSGTMSFLQPLVPNHPLDAVRDSLAYLAERGHAPIIERVGEDFMAGLPRDDCYAAQEDRDQFDYVYSVRELLDLPGEKYHDKKNLLAQFQKKYAYRYLPMTAESAEACIAFSHEWCVERHCEQSEGMTRENCAVVQMLGSFRDLPISGGVIEVDGQLVAFSLGEPLNQETFVIHAEKAISGFTGIYQAINWEFLRHVGTGYRYVNREQDLGIEGLRKAKLSYNPIQLGKKYRLSGQVSG